VVDGGNNITVDLNEIGWQVVDWINLAQERERWRFMLHWAFNPPDNAGGGGFLDQLRKC
jgi:hypothetical protein